jgi:hypothetical protein
MTKKNMSKIMITFALALIAYSLHSYGVASCAFSYLKAPLPSEWMEERRGRNSPSKELFNLTNHEERKEKCGADDTSDTEREGTFCVQGKALPFHQCHDP